MSWLNKRECKARASTNAAQFIKALQTLKSNKNTTIEIKVFSDNTVDIVATDTMLKMTTRSI